VPFLLAEQRRGWSLMIFLCSRNARPPKALVGRAQLGIHQASPFGPSRSSRLSRTSRVKETISPREKEITMTSGSAGAPA
jgi:hypothetical protein